MTFEVEVDGRLIAVAVERVDGMRRFRVTVDGKPRVVDVARPADYTLSLLAVNPAGDAAGQEKETVPPAQASVDLQITPAAAGGELLVRLEGRTINVSVNGRRSAHADGDAHGHGHSSSIVAPMPGRVVRLLAAAGDEVAARQGVVVVEAMKMENELRAPRAGRVKEIGVTPGMSVEAGRILAVIE